MLQKIVYMIKSKYKKINVLYYLKNNYVNSLNILKLYY